MWTVNSDPLAVSDARWATDNFCCGVASHACSADQIQKFSQRIHDQHFDRRQLERICDAAASARSDNRIHLSFIGAIVDDPRLEDALTSVFSEIARCEQLRVFSRTALGSCLMDCASRHIQPDAEDCMNSLRASFDKREEGRLTLRDVNTLGAMIKFGIFSPEQVEEISALAAERRRHYARFELEQPLRNMDAILEAASSRQAA